MGVLDILQYLLGNALHKPVYRVHWSADPWGRMGEEKSSVLDELKRDKRFADDVEFRHVVVMGESSDWVCCGKVSFRRMKERLEPLGVTFSKVGTPAMFDYLPANS